MECMSRRSVLGATAALTAAALPMPHIARAEATTATLWQTQGFVPQEDAAFRKVIADYEKASGNKIDYSISPFMALMQKTVAALTSGEVPDVVSMDAPDTLLSQNAWDDRLIDVSDVVETQKAAISEASLLYSLRLQQHYQEARLLLRSLQAGRCSVPCLGQPGRESRATIFPTRRRPGMRSGTSSSRCRQSCARRGCVGIYALGMQLTTVGPNDGNGVFYGFLIANGGKDIVTPNGKLNVADPKVREAAIKSVAYMTAAYKDGYVPLESLSWSDADDNNAFHEKLLLMDFDGTISTELALFDKKELYKEMVTLGLPLGNDGQPIPAQVGASGGFIPKGAKNVAVAKDFLRYIVQPKVANEYLKNGLGRWLPAVPAMVKEDPWWLDPSDPHRRPVRPGVPARADDAGLQRIQSGLGARGRRTALGPSVRRGGQGRRHT